MQFSDIIEIIQKVSTELDLPIEALKFKEHDDADTRGYYFSVHGKQHILTRVDADGDIFYSNVLSFAELVSTRWFFLPAIGSWQIDGYGNICDANWQTIVPAHTVLDVRRRKGQKDKKYYNSAVLNFLENSWDGMVEFVFTLRQAAVERYRTGEDPSRYDQKALDDSIRFLIDSHKESNRG